MANTIGLRVYRLSVQRDGDRSELAFDAPELHVAVQDFVRSFVGARLAITQRSDLERSWFFEHKIAPTYSNIKGYIHYGTYGFESNLIGALTMQTNYRRKADDIEEIPLYFEFWFPSGAKFGLLALQSFQSRSCVGIVLDDLRQAFVQQNADVRLIVKKLMPNDVKGSLFNQLPVKKLTLIKKSVPSDLADRYTGGGQSSEVNLEISLSAKRRGTLGTFGSISGYLKDGEQSAIVFDGTDFDEAVAEVSIGGRRRRVGVYGRNSEAGVIDMTDSVTKGVDGHPTFESLARETRSILAEFYGVLAASRR